MRFKEKKVAYLLVESFFQLSGFLHKDILSDCEFPWDALTKLPDYLKTQKLGVIEAAIPDSACIKAAELVSIGAGTIVDPGVYIKGPCIIGKNCRIVHGSYIRENVIIGDNCVVGHSSEIKNSILLNNVSASHFNYVGDSILGNFVNLGAGVKIANQRLDKSEITIRLGNRKIKTPLKKLGIIMGDGSQLGCNCVANPGTILEKNVFCWPSINISGFFQEGMVIRSLNRIKPNNFIGIYG